MTTTTIARPSAGICWPPTLWVLGLHLGALLAFVPHYFSWSALAVCVFLHWVTASIGICLGYHRLLTHRSFALRPKALEYLVTAIGCCASQGGPIGWVADHRKHHAFSDQDEDVHSPIRSFFWAHMGWWMVPDADARHTVEFYKKWAPDLYRDPVLRVLDWSDVPLMLGSAVVLYLLGGMPWLVWGFFVRTVLVLHTTWFVNSAAHVWGYRSHATRDRSTNCWWVAILSYGEGWHNNHHAFQTSARSGLKWWEIDVTYALIRLLSWLRLAHTIKLPRPRTASPRNVSSRIDRGAEGDKVPLGDRTEDTLEPRFVEMAG